MLGAPSLASLRRWCNSTTPDVVTLIQRTALLLVLLRVAEETVLRTHPPRY